MTKQSKSVWYGLAAVTIGSGIFFLATNKGRLFKKGKAHIKALVSGKPTGPGAAPDPGSNDFKGRIPTPANGHVRDVAATSPPTPETGSNFTPQGDVHAPKG